MEPYRDTSEHPGRVDGTGHDRETDTRRWDWNGGTRTDPDPAHTADAADGTDAARAPRTADGSPAMAGRDDVIVYPDPDETDTSWSQRSEQPDRTTDGTEPEPVMDADQTSDPAGGEGDGAGPGTAELDFHQRWREVQAGFVDDPKDAVQQADQLVDEAVSAITSRRRTLADRWKNVDEKDTEQLRLTLRDYRSLLEDLVGLADSPAGRASAQARHEAR